MDTLLDAIREGRLFELPGDDKSDALQFLAHIIEAFPEVPAGTDVLGYVVKREEATNTGLGRGWACPHARVPYDEDLMCAIGWSPVGIDYGAPDGARVRIVVMYLIPQNQRNHYLRELSVLAKALEGYPDREAANAITDLDGIRNYLLDLIEASKTAGPDTRARMIRLQAKLTPQAAPFHDLSNLLVEPVLVVAGPGIQTIVLTQNPTLTDVLDAAGELPEKLEAEGALNSGGWRILRRSAVSYQGGRIAYDCLAIKPTNGHT